MSTLSCRQRVLWPTSKTLGLEELGISVDRGKIVTDDYYRTNVEGYYAIGDVTKGQALAHVASAEAIICIEKIAGLPHVEPLNYNNIPGCTYCTPEIASVGYTEKAAREAGYELKVGKFPFSASGKAKAGWCTRRLCESYFRCQIRRVPGRSLHWLERNGNDC